ncbi:carbon-nitrogen hydrolase family protein [Peribacillus saganii]|uniref:Carbon-nitrogen hydrolase family protein n=1 Tax=Peribacillus saganii TaxID=2303992 RepID=A0A372LTL2_9BACI|nr:carbon-nitrogen hydrolase family protein [Peribacillus saganii]RFU70894.1 carbon-nitrogen hydrolase family protein [Peribacillus saganii]
MKTMRQFTAAAVQVSPILPFNKEKTVDLVCEIVSEAADKGAKLIVFPECFIPSFPNWTLDLNDSSAWELHLRDFTYNSILVPGPETDKIGRVAKEKGVYVVVGVNEIEEKYVGVLYNSLVFIGPEGNVIGKHRKLFPTMREKLFHARGDASGLNVYDTEIGRLGGLICYEHLQPLLKYSLIGQGEQIHCAAWPGWPDVVNGRTNKHVIDAASRTMALEGQSFVIVSSMYIPQSVSQNIDLGNSNWSFFGGSGIINPAGEYIGGPLYDQEGIVYGEIDLDLIPLRKATIDTTGRDSAWETISMNINHVERSPIKRTSDSTNKELIDKIEALESKLQDFEKRSAAEKQEILV